MAKTITLKTPVVMGSETVKSIVIREPKAKDLRSIPIGSMDKMTMGTMLDIAVTLSDQPQFVIDELSPADMKSVLEVVGGFLADTLGTGE